MARANGLSRIALPIRCGAVVAAIAVVVAFILLPCIHGSSHDAEAAGHCAVCQWLGSSAALPPPPPDRAAEAPAVECPPVPEAENLVAALLIVEHPARGPPSLLA